MKFISAQITYFLHNREAKRNMRYLLRFIYLLIALMIIFSIIFHIIMEEEGRYYSWITGLYWTLVVMSTLGLGDITFTSDMGKVFTIIVILSGIFLLLVMLPFTFIQFFYAPWLNAQNKMRIPRELSQNTNKHIIIIGSSATALELSLKLRQYGHEVYILCEDLQKAIELKNQDYTVCVGEYNDVNTYKNLRADFTTMIIALDSDVCNTSAILTLREATSRVPVICSASNKDSVDILMAAGSTYVFPFTQLLGQTLARRTVVSNARSGIIGEFGSLFVAETPVMGTNLINSTLRSADVRAVAGINVVGIWDRGHFKLPDPDEKLTIGTVLVIAGSQEQILAFNAHVRQDTNDNAPVLILGGGRVGLAAAEYFAASNIDYCIVEKNPRITSDKIITGNATDHDILQKAGISNAPSILITTHDDDMNTYLAIYCRRLRKDAQIISRATLDRNINTLHTAGADLVMSYSSLVTNTILNLLSPEKVLMLSEGLNIFKVEVPEDLIDKKLVDSNIRSDTNCNVIALIINKEVIANPDPEIVLQGDYELVLIGNTESEKKFFELYAQDE